MRYFKIVLGLLLIATLFSIGLIFANGHIRSDTVIGVFSFNSEICVSGNQTAHYTNGRYVTFPERSSTLSARVDSSQYNVDPPPLGCTNQGNFTSIVVDDTSAASQNEIVCLWASNPLPTYDCRDTTPPTISNLTAGSITQTGATITWTTAGEPGSTTHTIKYGTTSGSYDSYPNTKAAGSGTSASGAL